MSTVRTFCEICLTANELLPNILPTEKSEEELFCENIPRFHVPQPTLEMSECIADAVCKIEQGKVVGNPFPATPMDLTRYFDNPLLLYCSNLCATSHKKIRLPTAVYDWIDRQKKRTKGHRRRTPYDMPYGDGGFYYYETDVAFAARVELLCRAMNTRKDAVALHASPLYISKFYALEANHEGALDSKERRDLTFKVEDYVYFELWTCYSFLIEAAAMLMMIPDKNIRLLCQKALMENWGVFIPKTFVDPLSVDEADKKEESSDSQTRSDDKPQSEEDVSENTFSENNSNDSIQTQVPPAPLSILARIAYMRFFLYDLWNRLERYKFYRCSQTDGIFSSQLDIRSQEIQEIINQTISPIATMIMITGGSNLCAPSTSRLEIKYDIKGSFVDGQADNPSESIQIAKKCNAHLHDLVEQITAPIDIRKYKENPIYGPVAFCNPSHWGVSDFLNDLENSHRAVIKNERLPKNKRWKLLKDLYLSLSTFTGYA